jgi:hypothetical protein
MLRYSENRITAAASQLASSTSYAQAQYLSWAEKGSQVNGEAYGRLFLPQIVSRD